MADLTVPVCFLGCFCSSVAQFSVCVSAVNKRAPEGVELQRIHPTRPETLPQGVRGGTCPSSPHGLGPPLNSAPAPRSSHRLLFIKKYQKTECWFLLFSFYFFFIFFPWSSGLRWTPARFYKPFTPFFFFFVLFERFWAYRTAEEIKTDILCLSFHIKASVWFSVKRLTEEPGSIYLRGVCSVWACTVQNTE